MRVTMKWLPLEVVGKGPTRSLPICIIVINCQIDKTTKDTLFQTFDFTGMGLVEICPLKFASFVYWQISQHW